MRFAIFFLCCLLISTPVLANPPVPAKKLDNLDALQEQIGKEKEQEKALQAEMRKMESELGNIRRKLVDSAAAIRSSEESLQKLEKQISSAEIRKEEIENHLEQDREALAQMVLMLERMRRIPPQALIVRPGAPLQTAQTSLLLQNILPDVYARAESMRTKLEELQDLTRSLAQDRESVRKTVRALEDEHTNMTALMRDRERLFKRLQKDQSDQVARIQAMTRQAENLQDLARRLEEDRQREQARQASRRGLLSRRADDMPAQGSAQLPVSGIIRTRFGDTDHLGAKSQGLTVTGRAGALVVAPMGGVVRFAGAFRNHGQIVILEHEQNYHSLIAGLSRIDTVVGQSVLPGEPLGILPDSGADGRVSLYYELRHQGQAVNPSRKLGELGS